MNIPSWDRRGDSDSVSDTSLKQLTATSRGTRAAIGMSLVILGVLCALWIRTAWLSDDAMISLRQSG